MVLVSRLADCPAAAPYGPVTTGAETKMAALGLVMVFASNATAPFRANARAIVNDDLDGIVKFVADAKTDRILGAHILQHAASELIAEAVSVIEFGGSSEDLARTCHSHPTLSEAVKEAAMNVEKRALHILNR